MLHQEKIERITGSRVKHAARLSGGMIGDVFRVDLENGDTVVAKVSNDNDATLDIEARMLHYLETYSELPVPQVIYGEKQLLIMSYIPNSGGISAGVERDAAVHLAALHAVTAPQFGLEFDTLIGPLHQPNPPSDSWIDFFREQRLLYMADVAYQSGQLEKGLRKRIDALAPKLDNLLLEPPQPALIHGDMWAGNVLALNGRIAGFVDPAIYYAHAEIEFAFSTLFGTFGKAFFDHYEEFHPLQQGFFEVRRDIYNLYPLLVHVRLFGGGYAAQVSAILRRFGI